MLAASRQRTQIQSLSPGRRRKLMLSQSGKKRTAVAHAASLLLETGSYLLLETGGTLLLE